jgi:hypothetical protein
LAFGHVAAHIFRVSGILCRSWILNSLEDEREGNENRKALRCLSAQTMREKEREREIERLMYFPSFFFEVFLITGSTRGIGRVAAEAFASRGANVVGRWRGRRVFCLVLS